MDTKEIEIACPCCSSRLVIDVRTQTVLRARRPEELDVTGKPKVSEKDWGDALGRVKSRTDEAPGRLDDLLAKEREKRSRLDDLFKAANDKLKDKDKDREQE
jgi:DNA-directed RNA polymerase subunit RPC12/RpoP